MLFNGELIKSRIKASGLNLLTLADQLGVTRQAVNSWIGGKVPRGEYLMKLCQILNVKLDDFFMMEKPVFTVPLHRTFRLKAVTDEIREQSTELVKQYVNLFRLAPTVSMLPVIRVQERNTGNEKAVAEWLRLNSGVPDGQPMDYTSAFNLLHKLGIYVIFRSFPEDLGKKSYAFYSQIAGQRVVFVNIDTNVVDLVFQLLHEGLHATRDEVPNAIDIEAEEDFCNKVAELAQFPDFYVNNVVISLRGCSTTAEFNSKLRNFSRTYGHSIWGIYYRLLHAKLLHSELKIAGTAENFKKEFPTIREILFKNQEPRHLIRCMFDLSPKFMELIMKQLADCSDRKLGEWLGLDNSMDAQMVKNEILQHQSK